MAVVADIAKARHLHELGDAFPRVKALGVELVCDHAHLVVDDHLARDQPLAILADGALAADEEMLVDPLPRALVEVLVHVPAIGDVEHELPARAQYLANGGPDPVLVLLVGAVSAPLAPL